MSFCENLEHFLMVMWEVITYHDCSVRLQSLLTFHFVTREPINCFVVLWEAKTSSFYVKIYNFSINVMWESYIVVPWETRTIRFCYVRICIPFHQCCVRIHNLSFVVVLWESGTSYFFSLCENLWPFNVESITFLLLCENP